MGYECSSLLMRHTLFNKTWSYTPAKGRYAKSLHVLFLPVSVSVNAPPGDRLLDDTCASGGAHVGNHTHDSVSHHPDSGVRTPAGAAIGS